MLRIVPNPEFTANVRLTVPGADAPAVVRVTFKHKSVQALADWKEAHKESTVATALSEVIVGWEGVSDERGEMVAYSKDALTVLLSQYAPAGEEILNAYLKEMTESRAKN